MLNGSNSDCMSKLTASAEMLNSRIQEKGFILLSSVYWEKSLIY